MIVGYLYHEATTSIPTVDSP